MAAAIKAKQPNTSVLGLDVDASTLKHAETSGLFEVLSSGDYSVLSGCDILVVCAPFPALETCFQAIRDTIAQNTILTDVCGIKGPIRDMAKRLCPHHAFVGGHPMAGGVVGGFKNHRLDLFEKATVAICAEPHVEEAAKKVSALWKHLGAELVSLAPEEHDHLVAATSHFPYVSSVLLQEYVQKHSEFEQLIGPGFQRQTRYALFDPKVMASIAGHNQFIPQVLRHFGESFLELAQRLEKNPNAFWEEISQSS